MYQHHQRRCTAQGGSMHEGSLSQTKEKKHALTRKCRVWKACERCRAKKTKCDGESPCRRCKLDGSICTLGKRKMLGYKAYSRGYAEVLENNQAALVASVLKLYTMVCEGQPWTFGKPGLNEQGQPILHHIIDKLGCTRLAYDTPSDDGVRSEGGDEREDKGMPDNRSITASTSLETTGLADGNGKRPKPLNMAADLPNGGDYTRQNLLSATSGCDQGSTSSSLRLGKMELDQSHLSESHSSFTPLISNGGCYFPEISMASFGPSPALTSDDFLRCSREDFHELFCGEFNCLDPVEERQQSGSRSLIFQEAPYLYH